MFPLVLADHGKDLDSSKFPQAGSATSGDTVMAFADDQNFSGVFDGAEGVYTCEHRLHSDRH